MILVALLISQHPERDVLAGKADISGKSILPTSYLLKAQKSECFNTQWVLPAAWGGTGKDRDKNHHPSGKADE